MTGQVSADILPDQRRKVIILNLAEALSAAGLQALAIREGEVIAVPFPTEPTVPLPHAPTHQDGGSDKINVQNLFGLLADPQTPLPHEITHRAGGTDELSVLNLGGFTGSTVNFLRADATFAIPPGVPGGSDREVQFNNAGAFEGAENITVVGNDAAGVLTLIKNIAITNQRTAGAVAENPSKIVTGGPNTVGLRIEGTASGAGGDWTPAEITTTLWLDATTIPGLSDNDPVSTWPDESGNSNNCTRSGATRPTYKTNQQDGKPGVLFTTASTTYLDITTGIAATDPWTVICLYKKTSAGGLAAMMGGAGTAPYSWYDYSDANVYVQTSTNFTTSAIGDNTSFTIGAARANNDATFVVRENGSVVSDSEAAFAEAGNFLYIGRRNAQYSGMTLLELVFVSSELATSDIEKIEGYLAWKWGLEANLPVGHPYKLAAPTIPADQTANLLEIGESSSITDLTVGPRGQITVVTQLVSDVAATLQAAAAQTGYVLEVKNSAGVSLHGIKPAAAVTYVPSNDVTDRTMNANNLTLHEIADIVITMQRDLHARFGGFL